jgi:hypothetical protein
LTLEVRGNPYSLFVFRRQRVAVFEEHRLPSTGSRWDIRWVSGRGKSWIFAYVWLLLRKTVLTLAVRGNIISC